jgi:hypothetical protein
MKKITRFENIHGMKILDIPSRQDFFHLNKLVRKISEISATTQNRSRNGQQQYRAGAHPKSEPTNTHVVDRNPTVACNATRGRPPPGTDQRCPQTNKQHQDISTPHNHRRAALCELQGGIFINITTQDRYRDPEILDFHPEHMYRPSAATPMLLKR